jgi:hypothetical protein
MEYQFLKKVIEKFGYKFFDYGNYNLNFIWVRNDMIADNHFTDDLYVAYKDEDIEKVLSLKATTVPGTKGSLYNPKTVGGVTGTSIIKEGQYIGSWKFVDSFKEFSNYPYFRQIKPIDYYRDGNKDNIIDTNIVQEDKIFGTHWHRMSNINDKRRLQDFEVNNWSLGCCGCPLGEFNKLIQLTRKAIRSGQPNIFTGIIINRKDLL